MFRTPVRSGVASAVTALAVLVAAWMAAASTSLHPDQPSPPLPRVLSPSEVVEAALATGDIQSFGVDLPSGQYVELLVEQRGVDVSVAVLAPDQTTIAEADGPMATYGPERLSFVTTLGGPHHVEIRASKRLPDSGRYELRVTGLRPATARDRTRTAAERVLVEAEHLRARSTPDAVRDAIGRFEEALRLSRAARDPRSEAAALTGLGRARQDLGDVRKGVDLYRQALPLHRQTGDGSAYAATLNYLGLAYEYLAEQSRARAALDEALEVSRAAPDRRVEALTLNNLGLVYLHLGEKEKALRYFREALPGHQDVGNRRGEATTLSNIGTLYDSTGEKQLALDYLHRALSLRWLAGDEREQATTLNNIGAVHRSLDEGDQALAFFRRARPHWQAAGDRMGEGATLHNIASVLGARGELQQALDYYRQALRLHRDAAYLTGEANILTNIGLVYAQLGDRQRALESYETALPKHRAARNRAGEAQTLLNLASTRLDAGEWRQAIDLYTEALRLTRDIRDRNREASVLTNLGRAYQFAGDMAQAMASYAQALEIHRAVGSRRGDALTRVGLGAAYAARGDGASALEHYRDALEIFRTVADRHGEALALFNLARLARDEGRLADARAASDAALAVVESLRRSVVNHELRSLYLASVQSYYELQIDVLMQLHERDSSAGFDEAAFQTSERARARGLLDLLAEAGADIRQGVDRDLLDRQAALARQLGERAERLTRLLSGPHRAEQAAAARRELAAVTDHHDEAEARIRMASPQYAALAETQPLSLAAIQRQVLDRNTVLLEYSLGDERSHLWAVSRESLASYALPSRSEIEDAARRLSEAVRTRTPTGEIHAAATVLSDILLTPAAAQLQGRRLLIVADGALHYVPFAALPCPRIAHERLAAREQDRPLIHRHEIVHVPSASALAMLRGDLAGREPAPRALAVVADPVFSRDDVRVVARNRPLPEHGGEIAASDTEPGRDLQRAAENTGFQGSAFPRLIGTRREATAILGLAPADRRKQALDFEASRATVASGELAQYRIVHFATHGLLDSRHPALSGLVLSLVNRSGEPQDGFLRLHDIYNLKLRADLVVLSACQTALGREIRGEGLVGLTRGFMYAGVPRLVATLWKVDDRATTELMRLFYERMFGAQRLSPAAALREAQIALSKQARWQAPYYWAAFVLQGEWQ